MSEFTSGNLVLNKYKEIIKEYNPVFVQTLNDSWSVFFTDDTNVSAAYPSDVMKITAETPILYFYNFEDHGWGFTILYQNKTLSTFGFSYEDEEAQLLDYVQERFPDEEAVELLYLNSDSDDFRDKMLSEFNKEYSELDKANKLIARLDVSDFSLFNLD